MHDVSTLLDKGERVKDSSLHNSTVYLLIESLCKILPYSQSRHLILGLEPYLTCKGAL